MSRIDAPRGTAATGPVPVTIVASPARNRAHTALAVAAGISLVAGPALFFAGLATSPVQDGEDKAGYIASLAADPMLTQASAVLLHYGNLLMGVGAIAFAWLVRGKRGAIPAVIGSLLTALALLNNSGALFADWMHMELGRTLAPAEGAMISEAVYGHLPFQLSFGLAPLIAVGLIVAGVGLVRAGVLGWWVFPAIVAGQAGMLLLPYSVPILPALGVTPLLAVFVAAGLRVFGRVRAERAR
jgi:hypothetical protein